MNATERSKIKTLLSRDQKLAFDFGDHLIKILRINDREDKVTLANGNVMDLREADVQKVVHLREAYHPCRRYDSEEVVTPNGGTSHRKGVKRSHPSYALLRFSKVSGQANLFESEINHQHYISMTISTADVNEEDSYRSYSPKEQLIEISMSEMQFSRAITSMNYASGVPVTLHRIEGNLLPEPPMKKSELELHRDRLDRVKDQIRDVVDNPLSKLREWRENKKRPTLKEMDQLIHDMECLRNNAGSNAEFAHTLLQEAMEDQVAASKTELDGYIRHAITSAGLQNIADMSSLGADNNNFIDAENLTRIESQSDEEQPSN